MTIPCGLYDGKMKSEPVPSLGRQQEAISGAELDEEAIWACPQLLHLNNGLALWVFADHLCRPDHFQEFEGNFETI